MNVIRWTRPAGTRWQGFGRLADLTNEIERFFDAPAGGFVGPAQLLNGWTPALDMREDKDTVVVKVELPGMKKEEIEVSLHDGCLSISGERKAEEKSKDSEVYRTERYVGRFERTVALPSPVAADKVSAQYQDGILTITLPKSEEAKPKQITVKDA